MNYITPEVEILELDVMDVIQTSSGPGGNTEDDDFIPGGDYELPGA